MKKELVIAKFKEDMTWINQDAVINSYDKIYIYDKSLPSQYFNTCQSPYSDKVILNSLPNIGREAHTYLHHIIRNYDNLSDIVTFVQGKPFDHCQNFIERIQKIEEELKHPTNYKFIENDSLIYYSSLFHEHTHDYYSTCEFDGNIHQALPLKDSFMILFPDSKLIPLRFFYGGGAQFSMLKESILQHSKSFYLSAMNFAYYGKKSIQNWCDSYNKKEISEPAHVFERLWSLIFTNNLNALIKKGKFEEKTS
jgi:hypothetical protein